MQEIVALTNSLAEHLRTRRSHHGRSRTARRALEALAPVRSHASSYIEAHQTMAPAFGRTSIRIVNFYTVPCSICGGGMSAAPSSYSRAENNAGMPRGPLIRFFVACVEPVLGHDGPKLRTLPTSSTATARTVSNPAVGLKKRKIPFKRSKFFETGILARGSATVDAPPKSSKGRNCSK